MGIDNPVHLIFIAAVALLVLGPRRLPEVARSLGKGIREFREAMSEGSVGGFVHPHEGGAVNAPVSPPPEAEVVADGGSGSVQPAGPEGVSGGDVAHGAGIEDVAAVGDAPAQVDPAQPVRSGDAPDRRPL